jgi:hypothetical protein
MSGSETREGTGLTYQQIEDEVRALAMSMPPSDFGSTRVIQAVALWTYDKLKDRSVLSTEGR